MDIVLPPTSVGGDRHRRDYKYTGFADLNDSSETRLARRDINNVGVYGLLVNNTNNMIVIVVTSRSNGYYTNHVLHKSLISAAATCSFPQFSILLTMYAAICQADGNLPAQV